MQHGIFALLMAGGALALGGCDQTPRATDNAAEPTAAAAVDHKDPVASAMAAAPAAIADGAVIVAANPDGTMKVLREGKNGWTCMPDNPNTPGKDPMCMDANALKWAEAWIAHKTPPANNVGLMYMLAGGSDASNMDPFGTKPAEGQEWVETGPHVMVVGSDSLNALYPGGPKPDTSKPYVMFGGTPYAHVMMPVN